MEHLLARGGRAARISLDEAVTFAPSAERRELVELLIVAPTAAARS